jgi:hypothetical protein
LKCNTIKKPPKDESATKPDKKETKKKSPPKRGRISESTVPEKAIEASQSQTRTTIDDNFPFTSAQLNKLDEILDDRFADYDIKMNKKI